MLKQLPKSIVAPVLGLILLITGLLFLPVADMPANAAPAAAATPTILNFVNRNVSITQATTTDPQDISEFSKLDIQYAVDQAATTNTITITLQNSVNGWDWADQATLLANSAEDTTAVTQVTAIGRYARVSISVANTNTVTPNVVALAK